MEGGVGERGGNRQEKEKKVFFSFSISSALPCISREHDKDSILFL